MEENKILEILKKVPLDTELYSPAFGKIKFNGIRDTLANEQRIAMLDENQIGIAFLTDGKFRKSGDVMLFPSKEMRSWDKLAWEKGDVLVDNEGNCCIFTGFLDGYPYVTFSAKLVLCNETVKSGILVEETRRWEKASNMTTEKYIEYINTKLEESNRRVNPETLEIEKSKLEFKDGDILATPYNSTFILKECRISGYFYYVAITYDGELYVNSGNNWYSKDIVVRYATEEEKTKLFDALKKEGKRWNAEKKVIEDIKPKPKKDSSTYKKVSDKPEHEFQPFERVLVRDQKTDEWTVDLYGSKRKVVHYNYKCVGGLCVYCIPYEGNEHLLGTTNNPED